MIRRKVKGECELGHYISIFLLGKAALPAGAVNKSDFAVAGFSAAVI